MNILFTSAGRRVELLRAFRQALHDLGLQGNIIALDMDPLAPALRVADKSFVVPQLHSEHFLPTLIEICEREQVALLFPLIDPDIIVLAQFRDALEATGAHVCVVGCEAAMTTGDKWLTSQFFREIGITTPQSWLVEHMDRVQMTYPLFIKPRNGSAAKYTFKILKQHELEFFMNYVPNPIIQEFLPGPEITNDVICDLTGEVIAVVSRQRIEVRNGEVSKGITIYEPVITDSCVRIARSLSAVGPITIQCIMKDNVPYFTEINARWGGGVPLGIAAGVNAPLLLLAKAAGIDINIPPLGTYQKHMYMSRFDDSFFFQK